MYLKCSLTALHHSLPSVNDAQLKYSTFFILSYVKEITSPGLMHETGCSGLVHWDDPEGWDGEGRGLGGSGWGTHVHPWQIHVNVWQNQYNIVK